MKKGDLLLRNSKISLDGIAKEMNAKIPAVAVLDNNNILVKRTFLKGDTTNGAMTTGIYGLKCNMQVENSHFSHFKAGGLMLAIRDHHHCFIKSNIFLTCETASMYI